MRPAGETGMSYIGHMEAFVACNIYLIVGNTRGVCEWKVFSSTGLNGRSIEG